MESSFVLPFIPPKLIPMVMAKAHETYPSYNATEAAIQMMAWWPVKLFFDTLVNVRNVK